MSFIRAPRAADQGYIAETWVRSLSGIGGREFNTRARDIAERVDAVLDRDDTRALIRHAPHDDDAILGWIVFVHGAAVPIVHMVYTRKEWHRTLLRERGIATELLEAAGVTRQRAVVYTSNGGGGLAKRLITAYPAATHVPLESFLAPLEPGES